MFKLPCLMCVKNRDEIYENTCLGGERELTSIDRLACENCLNHIYISSILSTKSLKSSIHNFDRKLNLLPISITRFNCSHENER